MFIQIILMYHSTNQVLRTLISLEIDNPLFYKPRNTETKRDVEMIQRT
jgi:hypothetical protein